MPRFVIEIDSSFLQEAIKNLTEATDDFRELLAGSVAHIVQRMVDNAFLEQGRPGQKWTPLSSKYAAWKEKKGYGEHILQLKGHLRNSISSNFTSHSMEVGSNVVYARIHQFGGTIKRKTRLARQAEALLKRKGGRGRAILEQVAKQRGADISYIPPRPYLPDELTEDERGELAHALIYYLNQRLHGEEG